MIDLGWIRLHADYIPFYIAIILGFWCLGGIYAKLISINKRITTLFECLDILNVIHKDVKKLEYINIAINTDYVRRTEQVKEG